MWQKGLPRHASFCPGHFSGMVSLYAARVILPSNRDYRLTKLLMKNDNSKSRPDFRQLEFGFDAPAPEAPPSKGVAKSPLESGGGNAPCRAAATYQDQRTDTLQRIADSLHRELTAATGVDIRLRITNNTSTMMSLRYESAGRRALVGLHHMFLEAPDDVRKALSAWIVKPSAKAPGKKLEAYIAERRHLIAAKPPKTVALRTRGEFFDLSALFEEVNQSEYGNEVITPITWGKMPALRRRRSIRFGSYSPCENLIRVHPLLDQDFVPVFFVRYIVFHEMLHAYMGIEETATGRRKIHPPEFRSREAAYFDYARALAWMQDEKNLRRLLRTPKG